MPFILALKNLYDYTWRDRLEAILRNAINLVIECDPRTLAKIASIVICWSRIHGIKEYFWNSVYSAREVFTAVYNKLDKPLSISSIKKTFNVYESNLDIKEAIKNNKIIIVDLASGFITRF
ncbi:MAG: hypothetical protein QW416_06940 [Candidatus Nitrosocaldaceae archaeon]